MYCCRRNLTSKRGDGLEREGKAGAFLAGGWRVLSSFVHLPLLYYVVLL